MIYLTGTASVVTGNLNAVNEWIFATKVYDQCFIFLTASETSETAPSLLALEFTAYSDLDKSKELFKRNDIRMDLVAGESSSDAEIRALGKFQLVAPDTTLVSPEPELPVLQSRGESLTENI